VSPPADRVTGTRAAVFVGLLAGFVAGVEAASWLRPSLLLDAESAWAIPRLGLGLFVIAAAAMAGGLGGAGFLLLYRNWLAAAEPVRLPFARGAVVAIAAGALIAGALLRFAALERLPPYVWVDDASLIAPTLALRGRPADFANSIRPAPFGVPRPYGSVGVLYLEAFRGSLRAFGTRMAGVRFLSAVGGICSVATAGLLGRALLPGGGGTLAALTLAGLRWNLIHSRWGWNAVVLAPVVDVAALLLLAARRRGLLPLTFLAGAVAGLAAHIYLSAWMAGGGLALLALWPRPEEASPRPRLASFLTFVAGYAIAALPIFLLAQGRTSPYFARVSNHNIVHETIRTRSPMPALRAAAGSLEAPWMGVDPSPLHGLPGRTILPLVVSLPVGIALAWSLVRPRKEISGYLLSQAACALGASFVGGEAGLPNSYRFTYLASATTVAAALGMLLLLSLTPSERRRTWAIGLLGIVVVAGAIGARESLVDWGRARSTFEHISGEDTLLGRAAARWDHYGSVSVAKGLGHSPLAVNAVRLYRLDPDASASAEPAPGRGDRSFRIGPPSTEPGPDERVVERVRDGWGKGWAVVLGRRPSQGNGKP
jgi:hypothetical protein